MRYLFNAVSDPRSANRWADRILLDRLERNSGDMIYSHAVMNTLAKDDSVDFLLTGYYYRQEPFSDREVEEIEATCGAFVCPLADMFSETWIGLVRHLTALIRRLRIPCVVPCVGVRDFGDSDRPTDIDADVAAFVRAVLDKSAVLGVRGESTARMLRRLGFKEGAHFVVLGCPSVYAYGPELPPLPPPGGIRFDRCAVTLNHRADPAFWNFVVRCGSLFGRADLVSQWFREPFHFMLTDRWWSRAFFAERPAFADAVAKYADEGRMRFFLNRRPWADFLSTLDFSVGNRIHGALLSIVSGTPAAVVPFESRTRELAEFHGVPVLRPVENESDEALRDRISSLDFSELVRRQRSGFAEYLSFFHRNGIETVFDRGIPDRAAFPLERTLPTSFPDDGMPPWRFHSPADRATALAAKTLMRLRETTAERPKDVPSDPERPAECAERISLRDRPHPLDSSFSIGFKNAEKRINDLVAKVNALLVIGNEAQDATKRRLAAAEKRLAAAEKRLAAAEKRLAAMRSSLSWRVTAPLRAALRPLGRGRRNR